MSATDQVSLAGSGFVESDHLDGDVDMFEVIRRLVAEKKDREANGDVRGTYVV